MKKTVVKVEQSQEPDEIVEKGVLAQAIVEISKSLARLQRGGINREGIIVLTQHNCKAVGSRFNKTKPNLATVRAVLDSLSDLQRQFT